MAQSRRKKEKMQRKRSPLPVLAACGAALMGIGLYALRPTEQKAVVQKSGLEQTIQQYGSIIFQYNGATPQTCYVIGQAHRNLFFKDADESMVPRTQLEILRIIERIYSSEGAQLVLREGMGNGVEWDQMYEQIASGIKKTADSIRYDDARTIQVFNKIEDMDAIMLAGATTPITVRSAEDATLLAISNRLCKTWATMPREQRAQELNLHESKNAQAFIAVSEYRSARILQNMPSIADEAYSSGQIRNKSAIIVIGLAHLDEMIRFVRNGQIQLNAIQSENLGPVNEQLKPNTWTYKFILPHALKPEMTKSCPELEAALYQDKK